MAVWLHPYHPIVERQRLRELGLSIGTLPVGAANSIADIEGVSVGHRTIIRDAPRVARTGVTVVNTAAPDLRNTLCFGGLHSFNGNGEMTGSHWLRESGLLRGPIAITNTHQVGLVRDTLVAEEVRRDPRLDWCLPLVGETYDGHLNDIAACSVTEADVLAAVADADRAGPVAEGNVGGGTGMICHGFKGGIGTSSRRVDTPSGTFTVGVLVQANYGQRSQLRLDGQPVGRAIPESVVPLPRKPEDDSGSIIAVIATDAPVLADQCVRLAQRATVGLARAGGTGANSSGDIFLAFSTANRIPTHPNGPLPVLTLPADHLTPLFLGVAEAMEEAIWNALCMADTMTGHQGNTVHAIPLELLVGP
jgi:D-aminopeptidase